MEATLIVVEGEAQAPQFNINLPAIIGRSRNADVKLGHPLVSRQHCELFEADGLLMVRDLGSLNGTYVGETRIANETSLEPGGLLTIGSVTFRAQYQATRVADDGHGAPLAAFAPLGDASAAANEETIQAGGLAGLGQFDEPQQAVEEGQADDGFGWLDDEAGQAAAVAPAAPPEEAPPIAEEAAEEEMDFGAVDMGEEPMQAPPVDEQPEELAFDAVDVEEAPVEPPMEEAGQAEFDLSFDEPDDTQSAPQAPPEPEVAAAVEAPEPPPAPQAPPAPEEEAAAPPAEDEFNFAPPSEEESQSQEGGDDNLDDFFNNLK